MKITYQELIAKAKATKTMDEFMNLAKEYEVNLPEADAKLYYDKLHMEQGELTDDEIDDVSGGFGCGGDEDPAMVMARRGYVQW